MKRIETIALINQKGGVAKTTTTVNLGIGLANAGKSVFLLDIDPQGTANIYAHLDSNSKISSANVIAGSPGGNRPNEQQKIGA